MMLGFCSVIATLGPIGYLTASGTVATLLALPCMYWLRINLDRFQYGVLLMLFFIMTIVIISCALSRFKRMDDPSEIVLDEVLGCFITFFDVPLSTASIIMGFMLFRFFDILKIGGVRYAERLVGAWGIVLDDVVAAVLSCLILRLLF